MPFIEFGLDNMQRNGIGAIIIQDSAGSGKSIGTNKRILKTHTFSKYKNASRFISTYGWSTN